MIYKIIEIIVRDKPSETMETIVGKKEVISCWKINNSDSETKYSIVIEEKNVEMMMDAISKTLKLNEQVENTKSITNVMILSPVEGFLPKIKSLEEKRKISKKKDKTVDRISTEEMYNDISNGKKPTQNFLLNVILASIVCSVGIIKEDISILIAASAIAPFLASILGYSFGISIGDNDLVKGTLKTLLFGLLLSMFVGAIIGFTWNYLPNTYNINMDSHIFKEMEFNQYTFILALASGASASLAITTGMSTMMASFMISVSILPNITISGITLGNGLYKLFLSSLILLSINLICIIFSSQIIFEFKKIRPKTKEAVEISKNSNVVNIVYCIFILIVLILLKILFIRAIAD